MAKNPKQTRTPKAPDDPEAAGLDIDDSEGGGISDATLRRVQGGRLPPDPDLGAPDVVTWEEDERIRSILADELNEAANLEIYRKDKVGKWAYLELMALADWGPEAKRDLAVKYGGGDYKGQVRRMAEGVRGQRGPAFQFTIDHSLKPVSTDKNGVNGDPFSFVERMNSANPVMPLMMQMMQQQQIHAREMAEQSRAHTETMITVLTAALNRPAAPASPPTSDRIVEVLLTKLLTDKPAATSPVNDLGGLLTAVGKLRAILRDDRDPEDEPDKGPGLFEKILTALPSVLKTLGQMQPGAEPARSLPPGPERPPAAEPAPPPVVDREPAPERSPSPVRSALQQTLQATLPGLVELADAKQAPGAVAQHISDQMPDPQFIELVNFLEQPDWFAQMADLHEPVMSRSPFFVELRERLLELAPDPGDDEGEDDGGETADGTGAEPVGEST